MDNNLQEALENETRKKQNEDEARAQRSIEIIQRQKEEESKQYFDIIQKYMNGESGSSQAKKSINNLLDERPDEDRDFHSKCLCRNITDEMVRRGYASKVDAFHDWYKKQKFEEINK